MDIRSLATEICPKRFNRRQKEKFLKHLDEIFEEQGYPSLRNEKRDFRGLTRNAIYAFEKSTKVYIAVPYDTPEHLFWYKSEYFPLDGGRSMNKNMIATYIPALIVYAIILIVVMFVAPLITNLAMQMFINLGVLISTLFLLFLMFRGIGNKYNANRTSSSVIAAVDFLKKLDRDQKRRIGFIFTDRNQKNCQGAKLLSSYFAQQNKNPEIIWLNCVGEGDTIGIGYRMHGKRLASSLNAGKKSKASLLCEMNGDKCMQTVMTYFDKGVMICAGRRDDKGSIVVNGTQSAKDRNIDETIVAEVVSLLHRTLLKK